MSKKNVKTSPEELLKGALVPEEDQPYKVPENWVWVKLASCLESLEYGYTASSTTDIVGPHYLRITDIQDNNVDWNNVPYCEISEKDSSKYQLTSGDIVVARTGATTGKSYLINKPPVSVFASYLIRLRTKQVITPDFLWNYMKSPMYWNQITVVKKGSAQPGANAKILGGLSLPLPPLDEQKRITDKVERLMDKINQAKLLIEEAKETFELRRAAILDKAFRGELTRSWRENHGLSIYKMNSGIQKSEHPYSLPNGWEWAFLEEVCEKITDGTHHSPKSYDSGDYKYITAKNIKEGRLELENITYVSTEIHREIYSRCDVKYGDVLYIKDGATTGIAAINELHEEFSMLSSVGMLRTNKQKLLPEYLMYCLNSPSMKGRMVGLMSGNAIRRLTLTKIKKGIIPIPPIEEQKEIVKIISKLFQIEEKGRASIEIERQLDNMQQSILSKAFQGGLGTNNSEDRSSIELLKNIQC